MATTTVNYTVVDGEVFGEKRGGAYYDYVPDPLGSVVAKLDNTQTQTDTYAYWPYGEVSDRTGTSVSPYQYIGTKGYYTDASGLTYVRARYLDTKNGRWPTQDPIGLIGGINPYQYVGNNPINAVDPTGLQNTGLLEKGGEAVVVIIEAGAGAGGSIGGGVIGGGIIVVGIGIAVVIVVGVAISRPQLPSGGSPGCHYRSTSPPGNPWQYYRPPILPPSGTYPGIRGGRKPHPSHPPTNPGRDPNGNCNPCPPNQVVIDTTGPHGPCPGAHWHCEKWNQASDCTCYFQRGRRMDGKEGGCIPPPAPSSC